MLDITTTATIRPKILDKTYYSFVKYLFTNPDNYRLIINIDPIGEDASPQDVLAVAKKYFRNIVCNIPTKPHFTKAVKWCWENTISDYVFHLEDDWILKSFIDMNTLINIIKNNKEIVSLRLNKIPIITNPPYKLFTTFDKPNISLNPSLLSGEFVKLAAQNLDKNKNPEKQLRPQNKLIGKYLQVKHVATYTEQGNVIHIKDIGRSWMESTKYCKNHGFKRWNKNP